MSVTQKFSVPVKYVFNFLVASFETKCSLRGQPGSAAARHIDSKDQEKLNEMTKIGCY